MAPRIWIIPSWASLLTLKILIATITMTVIFEVGALIIIETYNVSLERDKKLDLSYKRLINSYPNIFEKINYPIHLPASM